MNLTISGIAEAKLWAPTHTKIISIVDPNTPVFDSNVPHHTERFHDIEIPLDGYQEPTLQNIENILNFSRTFTDVDKVLIHCHAGMSRSPAIAILVLMQHGVDIKEAFDTVYAKRDCMNPNKLILSHGDGLFDCNGALIDYYAQWSHDKKIEYGRFAGQTTTGEVDKMKDILSMFK